MKTTKTKTTNRNAIRMPRQYRASYWIADDRDEIAFMSEHRAGSKANRADAMREIRARKGRAIAARAEIADIWRDITA